MEKYLLITIISFLFFKEIKAQRTFKEVNSFVKDNTIELGFSKGIMIMQNDTLILCRDASRLEVYDSSYNLLLDYAKKGKGPGEMMHIWDALIYKRQLVLLDIVNNKVSFYTFSKKPELIKEIPIKENGKRLFIIDNTLVVQHLMKDYLIAEYDEIGNIIATYPKLLENDRFNVFGLSGELFFDNDIFYLFKSFNNEFIKFKRNDENYIVQQKSQITYNNKSDKLEINVERVNDTKVFSPPKTNYLYIHQKVDDKLIIQNVEQKKGADRVIDIYNWSTLKYTYSVRIPAEINAKSTNMFFNKSIDSYLSRQIDDFSIINVSIDKNK